MKWPTLYLPVYGTGDVTAGAALEDAVGPVVKLVAADAVLEAYDYWLIEADGRRTAHHDRTQQRLRICKNNINHIISSTVRV